MRTHTEAPTSTASAREARSRAAHGIVGAMVWCVVLGASPVVIYLTRIRFYLTRIGFYLTRIGFCLTRIAIQPLTRRTICTPDAHGKKFHDES